MFSSARNSILGCSSKKILALRTGLYSYSTGHPARGEQELIDILRQKFPKAKCIAVEDISGGCGAMYQIHIEAPEFQGLNTVKQHRLVTEALKSQIKDMHGVRIHTQLPTDN